jgi:carboxymethylenebutenolidase
LLGFFGERDEYVNSAMTSMLDLQLAELGKVHKFLTYEGAHHAFFNSDRPEVYDEKAAEDSWQQMTKFFHRQLG